MQRPGLGCSGSEEREKRMDSKKGWEVILTEAGN